MARKNFWISMMLGCICFAKNKQKEDTGWLSFVKKYNGILLQLCKGVLKEEMKNTQLVARKWISVVDVHTQMMIQKDLVGYLETTKTNNNNNPKMCILTYVKIQSDPPRTTRNALKRQIFDLFTKSSSGHKYIQVLRQVECNLKTN